MPSTSLSPPSRAGLRRRTGPRCPGRSRRPLCNIYRSTPETRRDSPFSWVRGGSRNPAARLLDAPAALLTRLHARACCDEQGVGGSGCSTSMSFRSPTCTARSQRQRGRCATEKPPAAKHCPILLRTTPTLEMVHSELFNRTAALAAARLQALQSGVRRLAAWMPAWGVVASGALCGAFPTRCLGIGNVRSEAPMHC